MIKTACPLDCYDACAITCSPENTSKMIATPSHIVGNGALCALMNRYFPNANRITKPMVNGKEVSMSEALDAVANAIKDKKSLLYRGSGNLGVMQSVTNLLMERSGGYLTHGSLCDGAGQAGIEAGRGVNRLLPLEEIKKADTVIVWGRNITVTNSHLMPYIEGKNLVVIDPVKTPIAKMANLHIQLKPRSDFYLAMMLARFNIMEDAQDDEWLEKMGMDIDDFYDFTRTFRIKAILDYMGLSLDDMGDLMTYLQNDRVVILVGNGVQKYSIGHYVLWAIDSLAATLGLFGKEGCGVSFLGNSRLGFDDPFRVKTPTVSIVNTPFEEFDSVIVQGANPLESMPNTNRVKESIKEVDNLIYFGLYENETSKRANIIIPAKNFLEKDDIRLSYGHHIVTPMQKVVDSDIGISEYDFTQEILKRLNLTPIKSQEYYLSQYLEQCKKDGQYYIAPSYQEVPYKDGFGEDGDEEYEFIDDFDDDFENIRRFRKARKLKENKESKIEEFWLITPKSPHSLNTQFKQNDEVYIHPNFGFKDGQKITIYSEYGEVELKVKNSIDLREDSLMIYSGTKGVNNLTPSIISEEGEGACYQEVKLKIKELEDASK